MTTITEIINMGFDSHQSGKFAEAENAYQEALKLDCENAEACNLMGVLKLQQNDVETAIMWVEKAISIKPCEYFYETLFQAYIRGEFYDKIVSFEKDILSHYPKSFSLMFNMALAYKNLKQNQKAIEFYEKALKINPASYQGWFNLSTIYGIEGQMKNAISALKVCTKLKPHDKDTEYFLSTAYFKAKDYEHGFKLFENRICRETAIGIQAKTYPNLAPIDKIWKGQNIKDKTVYVDYEAGFGDTIMFSRYLPLLRQKCNKVVFYPQRQLVPLFAQSGLGIDEVIDGYIPEQNMDFDIHVPLMSIPYLLGLKGNKVFEASDGYLKADMELAEEYRNKFFNNDKIKIGIKWQGNTFYDKDRVLPVEKFAPLIEIEGTQFYSFQTFEGSEDLVNLTDKYNIIDIGSDLMDFGQTAAAMMNLDLVICNDTSLAHLAGALGIPCFVVLPYDVNWRWHSGEGVSDWYDSITLFRQKSVDDWESAFSEVKERIISALEKTVKA